MRWLAVGLVFSLGLASGSLISFGTAEGAGGKESRFDRTLVIEDGESLRIENRSPDKAYVVQVEGKDGAKVLNSDKGTLDVPKEDVVKVTIYGLQAIAVWEKDLGSRKCRQEVCTFPPPPPPDWNPSFIGAGRPSGRRPS